MVACLRILNPTKWLGKVIPLDHSPFVIGRGLHCNLRATSSRLGDRHCAVILQGSKAYLRDLHESDDTFLDDRPVHGTVQICHGQHLRLGPLVLAVCLEEANASVLENEAAALLLAPDENDEWDGVLTDGSTAEARNHAGASGGTLTAGPAHAAERILQQYPDLEVPVLRPKR